MNPVTLPVQKHDKFRLLRRRLKNDLFFRDYFDQHRCVFVHIPKSAGSSVKQALFPGTEGPGHRMAMDYQLENPKKFNDYFVFTFVRNPYDRLVSAYTYLTGNTGSQKDKQFHREVLSKYQDFRDFVLNGLHTKEVQKKWHLRPQHYYTVNFNGDNIVDFIGKVENVDQDFAHVCQKLNKSAKLVHKNKSARKRDCMAYYDEETRAKAAEFYHWDFVLFDYPK